MKLFYVGAMLLLTITLVLSGLTHGYAQPRPNQSQKRSSQPTIQRPTEANASKTETKPAANAQSSQLGVPEQDVDSLLSNEDKAEIDKAMDLFKQSDYSGALDILRAVTATNSNLLPPRLILAQWFAETGNQSAIRISLEKAVEETPDDPEAYLLLGEIALNQGEFAAADLLFQKVDTLNRAVTHENRQKQLGVKLLRDRARLCQVRQQWQAMQGFLSALLKLEGETADNCRLVALSFFELGKEQPAHDWFAHADQLDNGEGLPADAQMALLYREKGETQKARESLKKALDSHPDSLVTMKLSLTNALNDNDLNAASEASEMLYKADPKNPATLRLCGITALYREDYLTAERFVREGLAVAPDDPELNNILALALCEQNDSEKAKQALQIASSNLQSHGENREYVTTLGWTLYKAGEKDRAWKVLQQAAAGRMNAVTAYYLAVLEFESGRKENAKKLVTLSLSNSSPFIKRAAAEALLQQL